MAQLGRALRSGRRGRWFKSTRPDNSVAPREQALSGLLSLPGRATPSRRCSNARFLSLRSLTSRCVDVMPPRVRSPALRFGVPDTSGVKSTRPDGRRSHVVRVRSPCRPHPTTVKPPRELCSPVCFPSPGSASLKGCCASSIAPNSWTVSGTPSPGSTASPPNVTILGEGSSGPAAPWHHITTSGSREAPGRLKHHPREPQ